MIGIICAMALEVQGFKSKMTDVKKESVAGIDFWSGKLENKDCVCAECGIGKVNAAMCTQIMILKYSPDAIINSGVAGALRSGMRISDVVVATNVIQHDMDLTDFGEEPGTVNFNDCKIKCFICDVPLANALVEACRGLDCKIYTGIVVSGDQFISSNQKRRQLSRDFNANACEMEGAAIGHVCVRNKVPFCVLRSVSDNIDNNQTVDFDKFKHAAAEKATNIILKMLKAI